jgi:UDP-glucose 4-epimerase
MMQKAFVTGAAGFIGSNLVDRLLSRGIEVVAWDNLCTGQEQFLAAARGESRFHFVHGDTLDTDGLRAAIRGADFVFHLAANADVRFGLEHPGKDLEQNTIATYNVLEAMRSTDARTIIFASSGSVYGEAEITPTPEEAPFPIQTSLYGASKLAAEALIQTYCEGFQFEGYIFRFVSILGERYTHGHVIDFYRQLLTYPDRLDVLGDGTQRKSYLYVQDCLDAILRVIDRRTAQNAPHHVQIYNLGTDHYCQVTDSIRWICEHLKLNPRLNFSGGSKGWVGDNPFIFLDTKKIRATGWRPKLSIEQAVVRTLQWLEQNQWLLERR